MIFAEWRYARSRQNILQFPSPHYGVHLGNILLDFVAEAFDQASRDNQFLGPSHGLVPGHFENRIDRFLLRTLDERTGVDHDDVGVRSPGGRVLLRPVPAGPS